MAELPRPGVEIPEIPEINKPGRPTGSINCDRCPRASASASLDHIIPLSKGGNNDRSNLRWVLIEINRAKADMTDKQFLEMCLAVVKSKAHLITEENTDCNFTLRSN